MVNTVIDGTGIPWFEIEPDKWAEGDTFEHARANHEVGGILSGWTLEQIENVWGLQASDN